MTRAQWLKQIERLARRRWAEREATLPRFVRLAWKDGSREARFRALLAAARELTEAPPDLTSRQLGPELPAGGPAAMGQGRHADLMDAPLQGPRLNNPGALP